MDQEAYGAVLAGVLATLFIAATLVSSFRRAATARETAIRTVYAFLMCFGLFASLWAAATGGRWQLVAGVAGIGAALAVLVSDLLHEWLRPMGDTYRWHVAQAVLALALVVVPAVLLGSTIWGLAV